MKRTKIEDALLLMGIPAGINGFTYIADAMEIFGEKGMGIGIVKDLYGEVALKNKRSVTSVERSIRYAFKVARDCQDRHGFVKHYIGFSHPQNENSLKQLYVMLRREEEL